MNKIKEKAINSERGVTLIALVLTVIILFILSGISIGVLTRKHWNYK